MPIDVTQPTSRDGLSLQELSLHHAIMAYRAGLGLAPIPLSRALTATAGRHVLDTRENIWAEDLAMPRGANLHSWSDAPYFADHRAPEVMWSAPARLGTGYTAPGFEISAAGFATVEAALEGWIASPAHNAVLANLGVWADAKFLAIGIGVDTSPGAGMFAGRIFHVWFGEAADPGVPEIGGTSDADTIQGTIFADVILGRGGDDRIRGGRGDDDLRGGAGADRLSGEAGDDALTGGAGDDRLFGGAGSDRLFGGEGDDRLAGGTGDDRLFGGAGDDVLIGGPGRDILTGGPGADAFVFAGLGDTGLGSGRDVIADFEPGIDVIDLSGIDARPMSDGDAAFTFIAAAAFRARAGQLRQADNILEGDVDGDGVADFQIRLRAVPASSSGGSDLPDGTLAIPLLGPGDFIL